MARFDSRRLQTSTGTRGAVLTAAAALLFACVSVSHPALAQTQSAPGGPGSDAASTPSTTAPAPAASVATSPEPGTEQQGVLPARLSYVEGQVRILQTSQHEASSPAPAVAGGNSGAAQQVPPPPPDEVFRDALTNMPVLAGMQVETGSGGRAELQFTDGNVVRLAPNSSVSLVAVQDSGERLAPLRGLSYFEVGTGGVLLVEAGPDQVRPAPGSLVRVDLDSTPFQVAVVAGSAHFNNPGSDVGFQAMAGETATLDPTSATAYDIRQDLASNSWDMWNQDRDAVLSQLAANETNARVGNGAAASASWNDLDYYGSWYNVPGAGMAWAPDGVDPDFDPYGQGAWGDYAGVGYTWVSAYPWGWLPYRCGGWSYFNQFGWMWQPGNGCGAFGSAGWYPYAGVHHAPPGYALPVRPHDPRIRNRLPVTPMPRALPLAAVNRGPNFQFRQVGGARPEPRAYPVNRAATADDGAASAPILPVTPVASGLAYRGAGGGYGGSGAGSGFVAGQARGAQNQHTGTGRTFVAPGAIAAPPRVLSAPRQAIAPPPRMVAPPVFVSPAPHISAPAAPARAH